jgi:homoaconitate hydratase
MGSRDAQAYLASPAVVAASAAAGYITAPNAVDSSLPERAWRELEVRSEARTVEILDGFPAKLDGRVLLLGVDSLNTDGIYGKDVTYRDDLAPEQMAGFAMANYDPTFQQIAEQGDIIVGGRNFGTGSSREQAATALKYRGIQLVIAASFSQTYLRNAFNNAFICLEAPALSAAIREALADRVASGERTIPTDPVSLDFGRSVATWRGTGYPISPLGPAAQELILAGGLEALTRKRLGL